MDDRDSKISCLLLPPPSYDNFEAVSYSKQPLDPQATSVAPPVSIQVQPTQDAPVVFTLPPNSQYHVTPTVQMFSYIINKTKYQNKYHKKVHLLFGLFKTLLIDVNTTVGSIRYARRLSASLCNVLKYNSVLHTLQRMYLLLVLTFFARQTIFAI